MAQPESSLPTLVIGAGAWGTAIAIHLASRSAPGAVTLWARDAEQIGLMRAARENKKYLPGIELPQSLRLETDLPNALASWREKARAHQSGKSSPGLDGLLVIGTPMSGLQEACTAVGQSLGRAAVGEALVWLAKGLEIRSSTLRWPHQIVQDSCPDWPVAALSGPSFALEVARGLPAALTVASQDLECARRVALALHGGGLRLYPTDDLIGVELGGAMKNVLAIAAGVCDGLALGANARAALLTRGLAEMSRLGQAIGARPQTFLGLATLGDLLLTATGDLSRNRRVGLALARGEKLDQVTKNLGHVAEGVNTGPALLALAKQTGVEVPITDSVCRLMSGAWSPQQAIAALMSRDPRDEDDH